MIRYQNSVKTPQMEKQMVKAMYSIEYSPQRHERYEQHYYLENNVFYSNIYIQN